MIGVIVYSPIRRSSRKGSRERTVGHRWRCNGCNGIVHEESIGTLDETNEEATARNVRIDRIVRAHRCPVAAIKTGDLD